MVAQIGYAFQAIEKKVIKGRDKKSSRHCGKLPLEQ